MSVRGCVVAGLAILLFRAVGAGEWRRGLALVSRAGWPLILVLLATPAALGCDAMGWRRILSNLGSPIAWARLWRIRLIAEAVVLAMPGGSVVAEAGKLALLGRTGGVPASRAAASLVLARATHMTAAALYLCATSVIVATLPPAALASRSVLLTLAAAASLFTLLISRGGVLLLRHSRVAWQMANQLQRIPWRRLSVLVAKHRGHLDEIDAEVASYFRAPLTARAVAFGSFLLQWMVDGAETALILTLVGAQLGLRQALILDALTSFARAAVVLVPAGLGVQETTQVFLLRQMGARDDAATAAALIFIKRTKELFWIVAGALLAAGTKESWQSTVPTRTPTWNHAPGKAPETSLASCSSVDPSTKPPRWSRSRRS
jgi:uncharacterized membrane protein YbhN (UPF0104 family)